MPPASSLASLEGDAAQWRSVVEDAVENIDLSDGTLRLHVKRQPGGRRVVVRVPDGEIEDLGTIFHVVVRDGHTALVGVDEGSVTIRLRGLKTITLGDGQTWERDAPSAVVARVSTQRPAMADTEREPRAPAVAREEVQPPAKAIAAPMPNTPPAAAGEREDALYLSFVRAWREGRMDAARELGGVYLTEFPDGFRHAEVRCVVAATSREVIR